MAEKYKVITLCGSARFKDTFTEIQNKLTLEGNIVLGPCFFEQSQVLTEETRKMLGEMHKRRIDMADEIFVINVDGYLGANTESEIAYAEAAGKTVLYLFPAGIKSGQ